VVQDSGGYSTGFTITQSVTIDAGLFNASVISTGATDLCTISASASDRVVLRGISFHGANIGTHGINATQVGSLYIEHCSISEFTSDGVLMVNGGDLFVTGTDVRKCFDGLVVGTNNATAFNLTGHDSRFTECNIGVVLESFSSGAAAGSLTNCTASLCGNGFDASAQNSSGGNVNLTLTNCRACDNSIGIVVTAVGTASATIRMANCVVTQNSIGMQTSAGSVAVIGTGPGTNVIAGNTTDGAPTSSVTLH
jgi:hypothetical protein